MASRQWALVTGVSVGGMGEGEVNAFLKRGVCVIATTIDLKLLEDCQFDSGKDGAYAVNLALDVTSSKSIAAAVKSVSSTTGGKLNFLMSMLDHKIAADVLTQSFSLNPI
jgi:NADP-dependent 3-hydroxy acid dehydrogenase YdfG